MSDIISPVISPSALSLHTLLGAQATQSSGTVHAANSSVIDAFERVKEQTGIVPSHLVPLQNIAAATNSIIGVRPVETVATGLIAAGHPTKDFHIKGKSANWGPQAGLICTNQAFSKLEKFKEDAPAKVTSANEQIQACIRDGHAVAVPLEISGERIGELIKLGHIAQLATRPHEEALRFSAQGPSQQQYAFEGRRTSASEDSYLITHKGVPVEVLAKHVGGKALTADYDLHMVAPHISDFGPQDTIPVPDVAHSVFTQRIDSYRHRHPVDGCFQLPEALRADYESAARFYQKEDPDLGNATPRIKQMIALINHQLVGNGERVVHHNADSGSPATDVEANYPATFFLPVRLGRFDEICMINDSRDMAELVKTAKDSGYHAPVNPLWEKEIVSIRRSDFVKAQRRFNQG
ncbi:anthrax toxin-like adenylyl cyclase domain-containing protein [Pseudomonas sp. NFPP24]|uniref:anthrax toxin-like adenylyl cyclase domain-containing protein n=1 Tax=Pseudomonas sp. NFPP24 TaxID=1566228 RepID=UPI0008E3DD50|nr:anthrax toxin-like adenylyl cyclase domain-containing protein [Pseudomonas sp. NFPP24]SFA81553.1 adenylate cyclase ExoY [Pseudomonas sp. NFPP24]